MATFSRWIEASAVIFKGKKLLDKRQISWATQQKPLQNFSEPYVSYFANNPAYSHLYLIKENKSNCCLKSYLMLTSTNFTDWLQQMANVSVYGHWTGIVKLLYTLFSKICNMHTKLCTSITSLDISVLKTILTCELSSRPLDVHSWK